MVYREYERKKIYLQGEDPWGSKKYAGNSTVYRSGCGLVTVTHAAIEIDKYADYTPMDLLEFMRQYSSDGKGTWWYGITAGLKHVDYEYIKEYEGDIVGGKMKPFYQELKNGDRIGALLIQNPLRDIKNEKDIPKGVKYKVITSNGKKKFVQLPPDGSVWTTKGHYVFIGGIKYEKGRYYLQVKDSGGSHNGWYAPSRSLKGLIRYMWTAKLPLTPINLPDRGYFKKGDRDPEVKKIQSFLKKRGFYKSGVKGNYLTKTTAAVKKFQKKYGLKVDGKFGGECLRKYIELEGIK